MHIDAALETPYYTIKLPDGTRKNTTGDNLLSLFEYERASSAVECAGGVRSCASSRSRSTSRSRQPVRSNSRGCHRWRSQRKESRGRDCGRSRSISSSKSIRCENGDIIVPCVHSCVHGRSRSNSPIPRRALSSAGRTSISPQGQSAASRERSPSPFRRGLSCREFLFFDEELDVHFFPVGESRTRF